jgi:hypothetical protein
VVSMHPKVRGSYRITLRPDGTVELTVRAGEADVFSANGSEVLRYGQTMLARGGQADTEFQIVGAVAGDEFDRWNSDRDRDLDRSVSARYVSPDVAGTEELDANGDWVYDDPYGYVWAPRVAPGWAPYREGRWGWEDYFGWTWISADPWGWAPYHYGRWEYTAAQGWFWIPGSVWGAAWVAFAVGPSQVGWCPLDYWNRPVLLERPDSSRIGLSAGGLDVRGWQFVPVDQFGERGPDSPYLRSDRLSRSTPVAITGTLPPMNRPLAYPGAAMAWLDRARGSLSALPIPGYSGGQLRSFRALEPGSPPARPPSPGRPEAGVVAHRSAPRPGATGSPWTLVAPVHPGPELSSTSSNPKGPAVDRLVGGTRPPNAPPPSPRTRVGGRPDGSSNTAPRPRPKTPPRPIPPPDDSPQPPADSAPDQ